MKYSSCLMATGRLMLVLVTGGAGAGPTTEFGPTQVITTSSDGAISIFAADLDGDGDQDVLSASFSDDKIAWYENTDGAGAFGPQKVINIPEPDDIGNNGNEGNADGAISVFAADLDGDGDLDVLSASRNDNKIAWHENTNGMGAFGQQQTITTLADGAQAVFAADLDGDGDLDVLSASINDDKIAWYENTDGRGAFGPQQVITTSADGASSVFAADLDGDGDLDVLFASMSDDKIAWCENTNGEGEFGPLQVITTSADAAGSVYAADLDGDGDVDVLSASRNDDKIAWYENTDGLGAFGPQQVITTSADGARSVFAADLNGDGNQDVLSASFDDDKIAWYENMGGAGEFGPQQVITTSTDGAWSVFAADLDGDGDQDVLSASFFDDKIAWAENLSASRFFDFAANGAQGWTPLSAGETSASSDGGLGLCLFVPETGENFGLWDMPEDGYIPLTRNSVYRIRFELTTDQDLPNAQPIWNILWSNLQQGIISWGGERWFYDNTGGANGIGQTARSGLTQFDAWAVPAAVSTVQWNGDVDPDDSAFSPANVPFSDFGISFRVLDFDSAGGGALGSQFDFGTICLSAVRVDRFSLSDLSFDDPPLFGAGPAGELIYEDLNGNGNLDAAINEDVNGNGVLDPAEDRNGNGLIDILSEDLNGNGILEILDEDLNNNGVLDLNLNEDVNFNGELDVDEDINNNGILDSNINEDLNGNGQLDVNEDWNRNGILDLNVSEDINRNGIFDDGEDFNLDGIFQVLVDEDPNHNFIQDPGEEWTGSGGRPQELNEDTNGNGILDPGEDLNGDGILQAGVSEDLNGNGVLDTLTEDLNGDGVVDIPGEDWNRNGFPDFFVRTEDLNGDGILNDGIEGPLLSEDLNGDGILSTVDEDLNGNGILDTNLSEDLNGNNILDTALVEDTNGNGVLDVFNEDVNGNGILDPSEDLNGDGILNDGIQAPLINEDMNGNGIIDTAGGSLDSQVQVLFTTEGSVVTRNEASVAVELGEPGGIGRAFVAFDDAASSGIPQMFPIVWNDNELLRLTAEITGPPEDQVESPVDVIALGWQAATNEIGGFDFITSGQRGGFYDRAASPRAITETDGQAQAYTSFFWTHHSTDVDLIERPDSNRLRAVLDFFNRDDLAGALGEGNLSDLLQIHSMTVHRVVYDEALFGPHAE